MPDESTQRFNHVAMSVPSQMIDETGSEEIFGFYRDVFGWTAMPGLSEPGKLLVMRAHSNEQFVFVAADDETPTQCASMDHFGLSVKTPEELDGIFECAEEYRARDERVRIVDRKTEDFKVLELHSFYVGFLLPLLVEVQCYDWADGVGPQSLPDAEQSPA
jgi:hypothetical protein